MRIQRRADQKPRGRFELGAVMIMSLLATPTWADSAWVTEADLVDAILEHRVFTPEQMADLDLNGDARVDAADLNCLQSLCHRKAAFQASSTEGEEGSTYGVVVEFAVPTTGTLNYSVSGSATPGSDYVSLGGSVPVTNSTSAVIVVTLLDDEELAEPIEEIVLQLEPGDGYKVSSASEHRVRIIDNDVVWKGTLQNSSSVLGFSLQLVHGPSGLTGALTSDGCGTLPAGTYPGSFSLSATEFVGTVYPILMPSTASSFDIPLLRTIEFNPADVLADPQLWAGRPDIDSDHVWGVYRETLASDGDGLIPRVSVGQFTLVRAPPGSAPSGGARCSGGSS